MKKSTMIVGYLAVLILLAGIVLKWLYVPAASILIVVGCIAFSLGYGIPLFLEKRKVAEDSFSKFKAIWVLSLIIVIPTAFMFMMQHWPGSFIIAMIAHLLLFASIPVFIIIAFKTKDQTKNINFHNEVIFLILWAAFAVFVWHMRLNRDVLNSYIVVNQNVITEIQFNETKSNEFFTTLENAVNTSNAGMSYLEKAKEVKNASDSLCDYIASLEKNMLKQIGLDSCELDLKNMKWKKEITDVPAYVMIVENKGAELKQKINAYKEMVEQNTNSRGKEIITLFFNTEDSKTKDEKVITWESEKFEHLPLITVLVGLNQMRSNVRLLEAETMIFIQAMVAKAVNNATAHNEEKKENKKEKK